FASDRTGLVGAAAVAAMVVAAVVGIMGASLLGPGLSATCAPARNDVVHGVSTIVVCRASLRVKSLNICIRRSHDRVAAHSAPAERGGPATGPRPATRSPAALVGARRGLGGACHLAGGPVAPPEQG